MCDQEQSCSCQANGNHQLKKYGHISGARESATIRVVIEWELVKYFEHKQTISDQEATVMNTNSRGPGEKMMCRWVQQNKLLNFWSFWEFWLKTLGLVMFLSDGLAVQIFLLVLVLLLASLIECISALPQYLSNFLLNSRWNMSQWLHPAPEIPGSNPTSDKVCTVIGIPFV